ncbi:MAG: ABC transporter ATP-binding protein [bacterium]
MAAPTPALELIHVNKRYGGVTALEDAGLVVRPGTIHAVLGENGAGKTTLMRVAYGLVRPESGEVWVAGRQLRMTSPMSAIAARIGMVHQHFTLVPTMTVAENLALGGRGRLRASEIAARVDQIAKQTGFTLDPYAHVETLPVGAQQRVEIAKALVRNATLLILDEPTAVLVPSEIEDLLRWLRSYVREGNAALLITHKLREALAVADDVTVLRRGRVAFAGLASSTTPEQLIDAMMGVALESEHEPTRSLPSVESMPVFVAKHMSVVDRQGHTRVHDATFEVLSGELVGIAAVEGSGQRELLRALAGRCSISGGTLNRPSVVGFVPEDRHHDALLLDRSLAENVALRGAGSRQGTLSWKGVHANTAALVTSYDVRAESTKRPARALSGGNQQKLVLARELEVTFDQPAPKALVVENPTRGLDVRASAAIHQRLRDAGARGAAVIIYSSDLDEVLSLSARVLVMYGGTLRELLSADREAIGRAMLGLH